MIRRFSILGFLLLLPAFSRADKVIMKDGTIYEGRIMGENRRSLLISNPSTDSPPRFIQLKDVQTIVRERRPFNILSLEEQRFASLTLGAGGQAYSSRVFSFSPGARISFGGAFRVHPCVELGGEFQFTPTLAGSGLALSDGQTIRGYESFYAYEGGFSAKVFPFYKHRAWTMEPYLTSGYHWNRLVPKASGDELRGNSFFGGAGVFIPWKKPWYWDLQFAYSHATYDSVKFLSGEGSISGVSNDSYTLTAGLSYRFL